MNRTEVQDYVLDAYSQANAEQQAELTKVLSAFSAMPSPSDELLQEVIDVTQKLMKEE